VHTGIYLHGLAFVVGVPEGKCRSGFPSVKPIARQSGEEVMPLTLDGLFFFGHGNVPPGQLFVHQINNE